jgi:NAD-dependent SIR2 family protein deacetylase
MTDTGADAPSSEALARAVTALRAATAIAITAGAGMGVDSGLPDFRGDEGFWNAYPPFRELGLSFMDLANPEWFDSDPHLAWGFYGHRLGLYRRTAPHAGFAILKRWASRARHGHFVFTSNVDGQFQRAGFAPARVHECHGAIDWLQCLARCGIGLFPADGVTVDVDTETFRARDPLPLCPRCGALARPNILMFGDWGWDDSRSSAQARAMVDWLETLGGRRDRRLLVIECGAGRAIPTVRRFGERLVEDEQATLLRINVREPEVPEGQIGIATGALAGLTALERVST